MPPKVVKREQYEDSIKRGKYIIHGVRLVEHLKDEEGVITEQSVLFPKRLEHRIQDKYNKHYTG